VCTGTWSGRENDTRKYERFYTTLRIAIQPLSLRDIQYCLETIASVLSVLTFVIGHPMSHCIREPTNCRCISARLNV